jgi:hypothetical protein
MILWKFKLLEDLAIDFNMFKEEDVYNALNFISAQPFLTRLTISGEIISSEVLNTCLKLNLQQFAMHCYSYWDDEPKTKNHTIKEVSIQCDEKPKYLNVDELLQKFAAVKSIELNRCSFTDDVSLVLVHELEHFRALKLTNCSFEPIFYFEPMCIPKLQELSLFFYIPVDECFRLIQYNLQIKKLEVNKLLTIYPEFLDIRSELNAEVSIRDD